MESRKGTVAVSRWAAACVAVGLAWSAGVCRAAELAAAVPTAITSNLVAEQPLMPVPAGPPLRSHDPEQAALAGTCPCMPDLSSTCCPDYCCPAPNPDWWFDGTGVMLRRDPRGHVDFVSVGPSIALSTSSLDIAMKGGVNLSIGHTFKEIPFQFELSCMWLDTWDTTATYRSPLPNLNSLFTNFGTNPGVVPPFDNNSFAQIREISRFEGQEINLRQVVCMPTSCLSGCIIYGVRHINVGEEFDYLSAVGPIPTPTVGVNTIARNDMWGPQLGALAEFSAYKHCWIDVLAKGAILNNNVGRETTATIVPPAVIAVVPPGTFFNTRAADTTSFLGDISVMLVYRPTPHFTTKIGYQALFLDHIALASHNLMATTTALATGPATLDLNGDVVYHGPRATVEFTW